MHAWATFAPRTRSAVWLGSAVGWLGFLFPTAQVLLFHWRFGFAPWGSGMLEFLPALLVSATLCAWLHLGVLPKGRLGTLLALFAVVQTTPRFLLLVLGFDGWLLR